MIPILYDTNEISFTSNGLGRLRDCISCLCSEERNGLYEVDFQYPVDGANYDLIQLGRIIGVTHDDTGDVQPFDIVSYSRPINGVVTFHAVHISYRMSYLTVTGSNINSLADAFTLLGTAEPNNPFTYQTDKDSTGYMAAADGTPRTVRSLLGGVEGSILDAYGGEYKFDKFLVSLLSSRGQARDFSIRYGVNMLDYNEDGDASGTYSSVIPYWTDGTNTVVGDRQDGFASTVTGRGECVPLDVSNEFEAQPTKAEVEAAGLAKLNGTNTALPTSSIKVSFVRLQDMSEYETYDALLQCQLCDTVNVIFPGYNTTGSFKIVKTVWNVLKDRFDEMELGTLSTTLAEALGINNSLDSNASANGGIEYFTLPNALGFSVWNGYGFKDKATGTVRIYIAAYNATQISGTRITTVPSDCLPTVTQLITGTIGLDINSIFLGSCRIDSATGNITNTASSVTRQVMVSAEYVYQ